MRIVYVGDNRNRDNFGCRATSTALSQLIGEHHEIVGRVYGNYTNGDVDNVFFYKHLPKKLYGTLPNKRHWNFIRKSLIIVFQFLGRRSRFGLPSYDFATYNWEKMIENLKACLPANPVLNECNLEQYDFDALVVNGEGSFIFADTPWRESVVEAMLMYWALKMRKKVYFLNAMFSEGIGGQLNLSSINAVKEIFESISYVGVREEMSYSFARKYFPNANLHLIPDALFTWSSIINDDYKPTEGKYFIGYSGASDFSYRYNFSSNYICVSGSSSSRMGKNIDITIAQYTKLVVDLMEQTGIEVVIVEPCTGDAFLRKVADKTGVKFIPVDTPIVPAAKILANACVYVTGRYHPAILASLGGTPCVFMGSNSHKTASLQKLLEYESVKEYSEIPNEKEIDSIVNDVQILIKEGKPLREKIKNRTSILSDKAMILKDIIK